MNAYRKSFQFTVTILLIIGLISILWDILHLVEHSSKKKVSEDLKKNFQETKIKMEKVKVKYELNRTHVQKLPEAIIIGEAKCGNCRYFYLISILFD